MATSGAVRAGRAFVELFADNSRLQQGLRVAESQLKEFGAKVSTMGRQLATVSLIPLIPAGIGTKIFAGFDDQMRAVQAVTGSTGEAFEQLTEKATYLGRTTSFTAQEVASGMLELGRAGFKSNEIDAAIASVMDLARSTQTEIPRATEIAGNALRGFGLEAGEMGRVSDVLATTANNSAQTLDDLGEAFKYVAPIADTAGMSLEETAKVLGTLANFGIKGSLAGTAVKNILTRMADPEVQASYTKLGISVKDAEGNLRNMSDVLKEVGQATASLPNAEKLAIFKDLFDMRALAGGAKLTAESFQSLCDAIDNASGESGRVAKQMDAGIGGAFRMFMSAAEGTAIAIGSTLAPELKKFTDYLTESTTRLTDWLNEHKESIIAITKLAAKVFILGVGLFTVGSAASAVANVIGMFRGALTLARVIVSALCTDLSVLVTHFKAIGTVIGPAISAFSSVGAAMAAAFSAKTGGVLALTNKDAYTATAVAISHAWASASSAVSSAFNAIYTTATGVISGVATLFTKTTMAIQSFSLASSVAAVKTAALATVQKLSVAAMGAARAGYAGVTVIMGLFSAANIAAAASVVKVTTVSLLAKGAVGAYGVAVAMCTGAIKTLSAIMMLLCAHPVMAALTALGGILGGLCLYLKDAGKYTAQLSDEMTKLADAGNKTRSLDDKKMEGLGKLSKKSEQGPLTDEEFTRGQSWVEELTGRYGDLGIQIDEVNKKIIIATDSQKKFLEAMNTQALQQKDNVIAEEEKNLAEMEKERNAKMARMEGWAGYGAATMRNIGRTFTLFTGVIDSPETAWTKQMDEQYKKIDEQRKKLSELRKERRLLAGGDETIAKGGSVEESVHNSVADIDNTTSSDESKQTLSGVAKFEEEQRRAGQSDWQNQREDIAAKWSDYRAKLELLIANEMGKANPDESKLGEWRGKLAQSWQGEDTEVTRASEKSKGQEQDAEKEDKAPVTDHELRVAETAANVAEKKIALSEAIAKGGSGRKEKEELLKAEAEHAKSEYDKAFAEIGQAHQAAKEANIELRAAKKSGDQERIEKAQTNWEKAQSTLQSASGAFNAVQNGNNAVDNLSQDPTKVTFGSKGTFNPFEAVGGQDNWQRRVLEDSLRIQKEIAKNTRPDEDGMI